MIPYTVAVLLIDYRIPVKPMIIISERKS